MMSNSQKELNVTPIEIIVMNHSELSELSSFNIEALEIMSAVLKAVFFFLPYSQNKTP